MEVETLAAIARKKTKQVAKAKLDLEITPTMKIGVCIYIKSKIVSLPTLKKRDAKHKAAVRTDRSYVRVGDPHVSVDSKLTALRYGGEYVPITEAETDSMKLPPQGKCLKIIGFFGKKIFGVHRLISNADCVVADPANPKASLALSCLIRALSEQEKVALCRFSVRENSEPKLVCLFPHADSQSECFYSVQVPFAEDSRENSLIFPSLPVPDEKLLAQIDDLIDSRMIENGALVPENTINPTLYRFWKTVEGRAQGQPPDYIAPIDSVLDQVLHPENFLPNIDHICVKLKSYLNEVVQESSESKKRKKFWREIHEKDLLIESPKKNIDVKRIRVESSQETRFFNDAHSQMSTQATQSLAAHAIPQAVSEAIQDVVQLLETSQPSKAANSIKNLREFCVEDQRPDVFNEFLQSLVSRSDTPPRFWRELIGAGLSLITRDEVKSAKPSLRDAHLLLETVMKMV